MRRLGFVSLFVVALAAGVSIGLVAGCGSSSSAQGPTTTFTAPPSPQPPPPAPEPASPPAPSKPARVYTKQDLARLVLQKQNAPADLEFVPEESGRKSLADIGLILPSQVRQAHSYGVRAVQDAVFQARGLSADARITERVWLLKSAKDASGWLEKSRADSVGLGFTALPPLSIGDESWAINGQVQDGVVITHAFRVDNVVVLVSSYASKKAVSPAAARAAALAALARARHA